MFSALFLLEMVVKLIGLGAGKYCSDPFNCFDGFIVCTSIVEFALAFQSGQAGSGSPVSAFRTLRILRILKLVKSWKSLRALAVDWGH